MRAHFFYGLGLNLADALARDTKLPADLFQRVRNPVIKPETHAKNLLLPGSQIRNNQQDLLAKKPPRGRLRRRKRFIVHDELSERRILIVIVPHRCFQRHGLLRDFLDIMDFTDIRAHLGGNLLRQRLAAKVLQEPAFYLLIFLNGLHHVHRNTDGARLVRQCPRYRLSDPPGGVSGELESFTIVELLDCLKKAYIPLLYQIKKRQVRRTADVFFGKRNHKPQVGLGQFFLSLLVSLLDAARQLFLLVSGKQGDSSNLAQVHLHRIRRKMLQINLLLAPLSLAFTFGRRRVLLDHIQKLARLKNFHARVLELLIQRFQKLDIGFNRGEFLHYLGVRHKPAVASFLDKSFYFSLGLSLPRGAF